MEIFILSSKLWLHKESPPHPTPKARDKGNNEVGIDKYFETRALYFESEA